MTKRKRATPYAQKARGGGKKRVKKGEPLVGQIQTDQTNSDVSNIIQRINIMTAEELARMKQMAGQNALNLFNKLLEEMAKRIPQMNDEVLTVSLNSVWEKVGGGKK